MSTYSAITLSPRDYRIVWTVNRARRLLTEEQSMTRAEDYQIALSPIRLRSHDLNANRGLQDGDIPSLIINTTYSHIHAIKMTSEDCATVLEQFVHDGKSAGAA